FCAKATSSQDSACQSTRFLICSWRRISSSMMMTLCSSQAIVDRQLQQKTAAEISERHRQHQQQHLCLHRLAHIDKTVKPHPAQGKQRNKETQQIDRQLYDCIFHQHPSFLPLL